MEKTPKKLNLKKYFDKIYILSYKSEERPEISENRINHLKQQFNLLFTNKFDQKFIEVRTLFNSSLFSDLFKFISSLNKEVNLWDDRSINVTMAHYMVLKEAYQQKYEHILILEDDCKFLKNIQNIKHILDNLPKNYDICQFHSGLNKCSIENINIPNLYMKPADSFIGFFNPVSSACNGYSRIGMKKFIDIFENWKGYKRKFYNKLVCDTFYDQLQDINYYILKNDLCICWQHDVLGKEDVMVDLNHCVFNEYKIDDYFVDNFIDNFADNIVE